MDASDTIRKRKAQALYINQLNNFIAQNPSGDCAVNTCCYTTSSCIKTFVSFENKYDYYYGKNACLSTGCTAYPLNGGSQ